MDEYAIYGSTKGGKESRRLKTAIYCRLSEEDKNKQSPQEDSVSIQNQKSMLASYAAERGWDIYDIYSDDDYTGADRRRPQFNRLLTEAEQRKFDVVLCKSQSRFTRELELVEKYIHGLFPLWGIRFVGVADNADTENKGNKKARQINGLVNEWYLEDMSESIKSVLTDRRKNGFHIGSFALYGYAKDPEHKGHLVIDEEAATVVREVFRLFAQGYGKTAIARLLNERGFPNPTEYKRRKGERYYQPKLANSTLWKYFNIADMLENEMYIGNMVQGKYASVSYKTKQNKPQPRERWLVVEGTHQPIIEQELWDTVQGLIALKAKPFAAGKVGIFARKVKCMYCGYTLRSSKTKERHYLKCPSRHVAKDACPGCFVAVSKLEQAVLTELRHMAAAYLDQDELAQQLQVMDTQNNRLARFQADLAEYQRKIDEYATGLKNLYLDKAKGLISESEYMEYAHDFKEKKERMEGLAEESRQVLEDIQAREQNHDIRRRIVEQYAELNTLEREIVVKLIDCIYVGRRDPATNELPIEIHWNF